MITRLRALYSALAVVQGAAAQEPSPGFVLAISVPASARIFDEVPLQVWLRNVDPERTATPVPMPVLGSNMNLVLTSDAGQVWQLRFGGPVPNPEYRRLRPGETLELVRVNLLSVFNSGSLGLPLGLLPPGCYTLSFTFQYGGKPLDSQAPRFCIVGPCEDAVPVLAPLWLKQESVTAQELRRARASLETCCSQCPRAFEYLAFFQATSLSVNPSSQLRAAAAAQFRRQFPSSPIADQARSIEAFLLQRLVLEPAEKAYQAELKKAWQRASTAETEMYQRADQAVGMQRVELTSSFQRRFPSSALTPELLFSLVREMSASTSELFFDLERDTPEGDAYCMALDLARDEFLRRFPHHHRARDPMFGPPPWPRELKQTLPREAAPMPRCSETRGKTRSPRELLQRAARLAGARRLREAGETLRAARAAGVDPNAALSVDAMIARLDQRFEEAAEKYDELARRLNRPDLGREAAELRQLAGTAAQVPADKHLEQ